MLSCCPAVAITSNVPGNPEASSASGSRGCVGTSPCARDFHDLQARNLITAWPSRLPRVAANVTKTSLPFGTITAPGTALDHVICSWIERTSAFPGGPACAESGWKAGRTFSYNTSCSRRAPAHLLRDSGVLLLLPATERMPTSPRRRMNPILPGQADKSPFVRIELFRTLRY
jgi:hypothetical protein